MAIASDFVGSAQKITPLFRSQNLCGTPWRRCCRGLQMCAYPFAIDDGYVSVSTQKFTMAPENAYRLEEMLFGDPS